MAKKKRPTKVRIEFDKDEVRELFRRFVWEAGPSKRSLRNQLRKKITEAHLVLHPPTNLEVVQDGEEGETVTREVPPKSVRGRKRTIRRAASS